MFRHATLSIQTRDVTTYAKKKSKNPTDDGEESADVSSDDDDDVVGSEVAPPACPEFALARRCFARRNSSS